MRKLCLVFMLVLLSGCISISQNATCTGTVSEGEREWTESYTLVSKDDNVTVYQKERIMDYAFKLEDSEDVSTLETLLTQSQNILNELEGVEYQYILQDTLAHEIVRIDLNTFKESVFPTNTLLDVDTQIPLKAQETINHYENLGFMCTIG